MSQRVPRFHLTLPLVHDRAECKICGFISFNTVSYDRYRKHAVLQHITACTPGSRTAAAESQVMPSAKPHVCRQHRLTLQYKAPFNILSVHSRCRFVPQVSRTLSSSSSSRCSLGSSNSQPRQQQASISRPGRQLAVTCRAADNRPPASSGSSAVAKFNPVYLVITGVWVSVCGCCWTGVQVRLSIKPARFTQMPAVQHHRCSHQHFAPLHTSLMVVHLLQYNQSSMIGLPCPSAYRVWVLWQTWGLQCGSGCCAGCQCSWQQSRAV